MFPNRFAFLDLGVMEKQSSVSAMVSNTKEANAIGGKTARACDGCVCNRARWFCAADDAFLCQSCDISVHSANPLAIRHVRVRLKTSSFKLSEESPVEPSWHTKRARTPRNAKFSIRRQRKSGETAQNSDPLVPESGGGETWNEESEEQSSCYRVPMISDQFVDNSSETGYGGSDLNGFFLPSEMELSEFDADVQSLLGKGFEEESLNMEALGIFDWDKKDSGGVKVEDEEQMNSAVDTGGNERPSEFHFNFDEEEGKTGELKRKKKEKVLLMLDYDGIMMAWADQRSPWTTGDRPELHTIDCWPLCMGSCGSNQHGHGDLGVIGAMGDGGREARVSRYREKRHRRLFSKKIRYQVRKLNAEKRPRMKGRFVKRADFASY